MPQLEVSLLQSQRDPGSCHQATVLATGLRLAALVPAPGRGKESVVKAHQHPRLRLGIRIHFANCPEKCFSNCRLLNTSRS